MVNYYQSMKEPVKANVFTLILIINPIFAFFAPLRGYINSLLVTRYLSLVTSNEDT